MKKKLMAVVLAAGLAAAAFAGCGSSDSGSTEGGSAADAGSEVTSSSVTNVSSAGAEDEYVVQVAQGAALCSAPIYIAIINGYMEDCGVNYEFIKTENQWDLMAGGKNDITYGLLPTFVQRMANGYDMNIVGGCHFGCINVVATDASGIESITDLKGRKVGIPGGMGSDPAILLQRMLTAYEVPITDVDLQVFDNTSLETALREGQIEAFVSWDPYATIVSEYEGNHLVFNQATDEKTKDEYCCMVGFSDTLVNEHPEVAKRYVQALAMACDYIEENPVEAARLIYEEGYVADEDYEFNGKLLDSYNYEMKFQDSKDSFVKVAQDLADLEIITINETPEELADRSFMNAGEIK